MKHALDTNDCDSEPTTKKRNLQGQRDSKIVKTSEAITNMLDTKVAKWFYACNILLSVIDNPIFVGMVESLRPGHKPPSK